MSTSDREIEAAKEGYLSVCACVLHDDAMAAALSAAATARPDWERIARELYEALKIVEPAILGSKQEIALLAFERASLGEGEGGR